MKKLTFTVVVAFALVLVTGSAREGAAAPLSSKTTPVSATAGCDGFHNVALVELSPSQTFALTDYVVASAATSQLLVTFISLSVGFPEIIIGRLAVGVPPGQTSTHTFGTPIGFSGANGNVAFYCNGTGAAVTVSGTVQ